MSSSVLVVGGDGWIGRALSADLAAAGFEVWATTRRDGQIGPKRPHLDLNDPAAALDGLPAVDAVVLAAATARLRDCADDPVASARANVVGTMVVAEAMARRGAYVLLLSTDKVFDGQVARRDRHDGVCPQTVYGRQKALAEAGVRALGDSGAVLRLAKVLGPDETLIAGWMVQLGAGRPVTPFCDMYLAPVSLDLVCSLTRRLIEARLPGIAQASGREDRSYAELAMDLARHLGADPALVLPGFADPARHPLANRPRHSSLEMGEEDRRFAIAQPNFETVLAEITQAASTTTASEVAVGG